MLFHFVSVSENNAGPRRSHVIWKPPGAPKSQSYKAPPAAGGHPVGQKHLSTSQTKWKPPSAPRLHGNNITPRATGKQLATQESLAVSRTTWKPPTTLGQPKSQLNSKDASPGNSPGPSQTSSKQSLATRESLESPEISGIATSCEGSSDETFAVVTEENDITNLK